MKLFKYILIPLIIGVLLTSCEGLMRGSERPRRPSVDHFIPPTDPGLVFSNLENAFTYREYDIYSRCLSDSLTSGREFHFDPAPVKAAFPPDWNVQSEELFFQELLAACPNDSLLILSITNDDVPDNDEGDTISYQINYNIVAHHTRQGVDRLFNGRSYIKLIRNNQNYWVIYYWQDIPISTDATWSDLKAYF
ncbi:MAG: hypothetical protein K9N05_01555 [Candidatus Marinimicrobia bacterium]|nr:hypothetical protein [Candidatus Neomarinimicrobiota bacterium]